MKSTLMIMIALLWATPVEAQQPTVQFSINNIVDAIYLAEGGAKAKKPFGILSVKCEGYNHCRRIAENTVRNNIKRWLDQGAEGDYLEFLARRYAPLNAENDPNNLNHSWLGNVRYFLAKGQ